MHPDVIGKIHIVYVYIAGRRVVARKNDPAGITIRRRGLWRGIGDIIVTTIGISPGMYQVEPMTDLMRTRPAEIIRRLRRTRRAESRILHHDSIRIAGAAYQAAITQRAVFQVTHPDVEILIAIPRVVPASSGRFHIVTDRESRDIGMLAHDTRGDIAVSIDPGKNEFHPDIGRPRNEIRRDAGRIRIQLLIVSVQNGDQKLNPDTASIPSYFVS